MMISLPESVIEVLEKLKTAGWEAYVVGGSVRDMLMGTSTTDWDFTTNATPEEILKVFPDGFYDNAFGTVGVPTQVKSQKSKVKNKETEENREPKPEIFEITTYRSEHGYTDRRRPDKVVWGTKLEDDLARRDFTINAIATDGEKIIDPYHGQEDIKNKLIRAVGNPDERFKEDALRLMRAIRIATELQFLIEPATQAAITKDANLITHISAERIQGELLRIMASPFAADGVLLLKNTGLFHHILPELEACFGVEQKSPERHHIYDVGTHLIESLRNCKSTDPVTRFATLIHDIGKPAVVKTTDRGVITFYNHEVVGTKIARSIADRLKLSKKDRTKLTTLVRWHQFTVDEKQTDSALRRFIRRVGVDNLDDMLHLRIADRIGGGAKETSWRTELFKKRLAEVQQQPFTVADLTVDGHDVMKVLNVKPGKIIGDTLEKLFAEVEEDLSRNSRDYLLKRLEELKVSGHDHLKIIDKP